MTTSRRSAWAAVIAIVWAAACGGSTTSQLFSGGDGGAGDDAANAGGDGASSGGDSDGGSDGGGGGDASRKDAAGGDAGPADPGILCSAPGSSPTYCTGTDYCCFTSSQVASTYQCASSGGLCATGIRVSCDDTADCRPGDVCCGAYDTFSNQFTEVRCASTCASSGSSVGVRFCDPAANDCPDGRACVTTMRIPGYHVCQN